MMILQQPRAGLGQAGVGELIGSLINIGGGIATGVLRNKAQSSAFRHERRLAQLELTHNTEISRLQKELQIELVREREKTKRIVEPKKIAAAGGVLQPAVIVGGVVAIAAIFVFGRRR